MKRFNQFFYLMFLVSIVSFIQVNEVSAQRSTKNTQRDHRSVAKTTPGKRVSPEKAFARNHRTATNKESVRDHRNQNTLNPVTLKNPAKYGNYRLNAIGKFVPFNPPNNVPNGYVAKGLGHCVSIPCPEGFGEDTVCWRCTEPPAPKPSAPDTKGTKN